MQVSLGCYKRGQTCRTKLVNREANLITSVLCTDQPRDFGTLACARLPWSHPKIPLERIPLMHPPTEVVRVAVPVSGLKGPHSGSCPCKGTHISALPLNLFSCYLKMSFFFKPSNRGYGQSRKGTKNRKMSLQRWKRQQNLRALRL